MYAQDATRINYVDTKLQRAGFPAQFLTLPYIPKIILDTGTRTSLNSISKWPCGASNKRGNMLLNLFPSVL